MGEQGAATVDVRGVVDASGAGGGSNGGKDWNLIYHFAAWRVGHGPVQQRPRMRLLQPIAKTDLTVAMAEVRPYAVWHVRATVADDPVGRWVLARVAERVGVDAADVELAAVADRLQTPVVVVDPQFGRLTLDRRFDQFQGEADWNGQPVRLTMPANGDAPWAGGLAVARALFADAAGWQRRVNAFAIARLLPLKNDVWLEDGERELSADDFVGRMRLESITVNDADDGGFTFWHDDGGLFWGHAIQIDGTLAAGPTDADIPG